MSNLRTVAQQVVEEWRTDYGSVRMASLMMKLEAALAERNELLEVVRDAITTLDRAGYPVAAEELRSAVAEIKSSPSPEVPSHSQTSESHAPTP